MNTRHSRLAKIRRSAGILLFGIVALAAMAGCGSSGGGGASNSPDPEGRIIGVMIDQTCDATDDMSEWGQEAVNKGVGAAAGDSGSFFGEAVTTAEYQDGAADVVAQFSSDKRGSGAKERDLRRQERRLLKSSEMKDLMTPKPGDCGSDLMGAVAALSASIGNEPMAETRSKDIVFVTNGIVIDEERGWNFIEDDITPEYIKDVIAAMKKEGTFPDLSGVSLQLVGLGDRQPPLRAEKKRQIQDFWKTFATESGVAVPGDYGDFGNVEQLKDPF